MRGLRRTAHFARLNHPIARFARPSPRCSLRSPHPVKPNFFFRVFVSPSECTLRIESFIKISRNSFSRNRNFFPVFVIRSECPLRIESLVKIGRGGTEL